MPALSQPGLFPDIYNSINKLLDSRLDNCDFQTKTNKEEGKHYPRCGTGRAKHVNGKDEETCDASNPDSKFNLDSGAFPSIINFFL